jgi:hypothetical protein
VSALHDNLDLPCLLFRFALRLPDLVLLERVALEPCVPVLGDDGVDGTAANALLEVREADRRRLTLLGACEADGAREPDDDVDWGVSTSSL